MTRASPKFASEHQTPPPEMVGGRSDGQPPGAGSSAVAEVVTVAELGRLLRWLRRRQARQAGEAVLTYRELAGKTGWSRGIIGEYFAGHVLPPTDRFDELIRLLDTTPAEQGALATARDRIEEHRRGRPSTNNSPVSARCGHRIGGPRRRIGGAVASAQGRALLRSPMAG